MHAFLHDSGGMTDLNSLLPPGSGWELTLASAINDSGQIVGVGTHNGAVRAFLLTTTFGLAVTVAGAGAPGSAVGVVPAPGPYRPGTVVGLTPHPATGTILTG